MTSFGEEGSDATPDPAPAGREGPGRREAGAGEAGGADQTTATAGRVGRGPRQEEGAAGPKSTSKAAPAPTVYRPAAGARARAATRTAPRAARRRTAFGGSPYAADPLRFLPKAAAAPAAPQRVGKFKWPPSPEKPAPKAAPSNTGLRRDGARRRPSSRPEGAGRRAGERLPVGLERGAARGGAARGPRGAREPRARDAVC